MPSADPVLDLMDRFTAALNAHDLDAVVALVTDDVVFESTSPPPDGVRHQGRDAVRRVWGQLLAQTPQARFVVEEQFSDGSARADCASCTAWSMSRRRSPCCIMICW